MNDKVKVLLVEDDKNLGQLIVEFLTIKNFDPVHASNGEEALLKCSEFHFDILIVDVMMPLMDGFTFVKKIRSSNQQTPVIFLTAKSLIADKVEAFKIGADDYVTKPFAMEELIMRINAVLRRSNKTIMGHDSSNFLIGSIQFDYESRILKSPTTSIKLTQKESELLYLLCKNQGHLLERSEALTRIWKNDNYFTSRSMDVYITKLRNYLKSEPNCEIENIHGTGYKLHNKKTN
jgi:two-component system, OmpR family, response regulator